MALFNGEAESYDKWYNTRMGEFADKVETECALSLFKVKPGMHLLDIGCGTGNFSFKLINLGASVVGIDASQEMLKIARKKALQYKTDIEFKEMNALNLNFLDNSFDGVLSMATIEFIVDYPRMISEMFRVCKKGGFILVGTINRESDWGALYQKTEYKEKVKLFQHAHFKTPEEICRVKSETLIDVKECLFIPPDLVEEKISMAKEKEYSQYKRGGFFCVLWQK